MNAPFKQDARMGRLSTALGQDVLSLLTFTAEEHVNALFTYRVEALAASDDVVFDDLVGTHATVHLTSFDLPEVPFDGVVTEAELIGEGDGGWRYALTLRPWIWLMGLRRKQQIFHEMSVVDILDEVFAPYGRDVTNKLSGDYPVLEYTVQYRESDLAFVCRMMERFGISYHFAHEAGAHGLVLTDNITAHDDLPGSSRKFQKVKDHRANEEHFWDMRPSQRLTTGKIRLTDYNFKSPDAAMETDRAGGAPYGEGEIESFDYPGDYLAQGPGKKVARLRVDQERGQDPRHRAIGDCASMRAGQVVKVTGDPVPGVSKSLCLSARHHYTAGGYGSDAKAEASYEGQYLLMPADTPLNPERKTPRAIVQGPQTAKVVGEGEIDCDEYGRILVRFHWDLDDRYSMRCRVSQNWAGKGWGGMVIPRIGMEVVVEFLEGDPDKPLVTGCVYNGKNDVPYPLPDNKTRSTFKTDTHKGNGFNELRFEDKKDAEEIFVHGQKDMNMEILNDRTKRIGRDQSEFVGNDKSIEVGGDHDEVISGNLSIAVGKNPLSSTLMKKTSAVFSGLGSVMEKMKIPDPFNFAKGNMQMFIEKNKSEVVNGASSEIVGVVKSTVVGHTFQQSVGKAMSVIVRGRHDTDIGQIMNIRVGEQFTIKVGENSMMTMSAEGDILIKGKSIKLDADDINFN